MSTGQARSVPTNSSQMRRLAVLRGPDRLWKEPQTIGYRFAGRLDLPRLETALRLLARRHSALRTCFAPDQPIEVAVCLPPAAARWPLRVVRLSPDPVVAAAEQSAALAWLGSGFQPYERPLLRASVVRQPAGDLLGLAVDTTVFDCQSEPLLLADLQYVYNGLAAEDPAAFDQVRSDAAAFAREERQWLAGDKGAAALSHWDGLNEGLAAYPRLTVPTAGAYDPAAGRRHHTLAITDEQVRTMRQRMRTLRASSFVLLATAGAASVRDHADSDDVALLFGYSRRTWPVAVDLVGSLAGPCQLRVAVGRDEPVTTLYRQVRSAAMHAALHGMLGHDEFLRIRFPEAYDRMPSIPFLHLNVVDAEDGPAFHLDGLPGTKVPMPVRPDGYTPPGISVEVSLGGAGAASIVAGYPDGMYDPGLVEELTEAIVRRCVTAG
ncbi:condensation domain-containing protein [Actinoplanes sp. NPDC049599]|uniref:condensation domain-containing protein n=1 Tax=Actinoplanes sp. NPDC049599 TaxID=3363903 RepID=UPI00379D81A9